MFDGFERDFEIPARIRVKTIKQISTLIDEHDGINPCFLYNKNTPGLCQDLKENKSFPKNVISRAGQRGETPGEAIFTCQSVID